jgi:hypothetical protein
MTTLLAIYNHSGCVGRCDANCYNATTPRCTCICGGENHGVGYERALKNNQRNLDALVNAYARQHPELGPLTANQKETPGQQHLF